MIQIVTLRMYFLISEFSEKHRTHLTKVTFAITKLARAWCNDVEILRLPAILKLQNLKRTNSINPIFF